MRLKVGKNGRGPELNKVCGGEDDVREPVTTEERVKSKFGAGRMLVQGKSGNKLWSGHQDSRMNFEMLLSGGKKNQCGLPGKEEATKRDVSV